MTTNNYNRTSMINMGKYEYIIYTDLLTKLK